MGTYVIVGAGGVGSGTAQLLVNAGHDVVLASRSGRPHCDPRVRTVPLDASDAAALTGLVAGADAIVNAANPGSYSRWRRDWPPMATAMLTAAERTGAGLVIVDNLYCYGKVDAPMSEQTTVRPNGPKGEVRAAMWRAAIEAHESGRARVCGLRSSDYFGPGCALGQSYVAKYVMVPAFEGRPVRLPMGRVDVPHALTYVPDVAALAARLAAGAGWGEVWHTPTNPARTMRQLADDVARLAGRPQPRVTAMPRAVVSAGGLVVPLLRSLWETRHQFEEPWLVDSSKAADRLGLRATPWDDALTATLDAIGHPSGPRPRSGLTPR